MVKHNGMDVTQELTFFMGYGSDITDLNWTPAGIRALEYAKSNTQMKQYSILLKHFWSFLIGSVEDMEVPAVYCKM